MARRKSKRKYRRKSKRRKSKRRKSRRKSKRRKSKRKSRRRKSKYNMKNMKKHVKNFLGLRQNPHHALKLAEKPSPEMKKRIKDYLRHRRRQNPHHALKRAGELPPELQRLILEKLSKRGIHATEGRHKRSPERRALNRRMKSLKKFGRKWKENRRTKVDFPGIPRGTILTVNDIHHKNMLPENALGLSQKQRVEYKRLVARSFTHKTDGYRDDWLYGSGPMATTFQAGNKAARKARRATLLALGNPNDDTIQGYNLPLPLNILRKNRYQQVPISDRYPRNADNSIDETDDIFWPKKRSEVRQHLQRIPSVEEIQSHGF